MKLTILFLALLPSAPAHAGDLTFEQIRDRLQVKGEMFYTDATGTKLLDKGGESRSWRLRKGSNNLQIEGNWSSNAEKADGFAIRSVWTLNRDGTIKGLIEEYGGEERLGAGKYKFKNLIKKEERTIENFAPVIWVSARPNSKGKTIVRFTPVLREDETPHPLSEIPVSGTDMLVYDSDGNVWTDHISGSGKFLGLTTVRGTFMISYYSFAGAKAMGSAKGNRMELTLADKKNLVIESKTDFLPADVNAVVYGRYLPEQKSNERSWTHLSTGNKENEFLDSMKD